MFYNLACIFAVSYSWKALPEIFMVRKQHLSDPRGENTETCAPQNAGSFLTNKGIQTVSKKALNANSTTTK